MRFQVTRHGSEALGVFLCVSEGAIAAIAKQPSNAPGFVTVIDML
jgi:hypothetical protein